MEPKKDLPKNMLLVDDDETVAKIVETWVKKTTIKHFSQVTNPEMAWAESLSKKFEIIVLDWNLSSDVNGIGLFNRWRSHEYYRTIPILVISGYLKDGDFSILDEFPLVQRLAKPLKADSFLEKVRVLHQQSLWYREQCMNLSTLFKALPSKDFMKQFDKVKEGTPSAYHMHYAAGILLMDHARYMDAEILLKKALAQKQDSLMVLSALGKLYLLMGENDKARKFLEHAAEKSPQNIERLCNLGDLCLQDMEIEKANEIFSRAVEIDKKHKRATGGKKICSDANDWMDQFSEIPTSYASLLNSIGINMARTGKFKECIDHYQNAMKMVSDSHLKSRLAFNLGLGYSRWQKKDKAKEWFKKSVEFDPEFKKAGDYLKQLSAKTEPAEAASETHPTTDEKTQEALPEATVAGSDEKTSDTNEMATEPAPQEENNKESSRVELGSYLCQKSSRRKIPSQLFRAQRTTFEILAPEKIAEDDSLLLIIDEKGYEFRVKNQNRIRVDNTEKYFVRLVGTDPSVNAEELLSVIAGNQLVWKKTV